MNKMKFIHISSDEIDSITHEMFFDYTDEIIGKSNPLNFNIQKVSDPGFRQDNRKTAKILT